MNEQDLQLLSGAQSFEQFTRRAKRGCNHCFGRGFLRFDDPSKLQQWAQPCRCTYGKETRQVWHRRETKYDSR